MLRDANWCQSIGYKKYYQEPEFYVMQIMLLFLVVKSFHLKNINLIVVMEKSWNF